MTTKKKASGGHILQWREGRSTPSVKTAGGKATSKDSGGKITKSRRATQAEEKKIANGQWIRTRPPGEPNKKSSVRPQMAKKQKRNLKD